MGAQPLPRLWAFEVVMAAEARGIGAEDNSSES